MNLFLLAAVPLTAVILHRWFSPTQTLVGSSRSWIAGSVWSILPLLVVAPVGRLRHFDGSVVSVLLGLTVTDVLLVPGAVVLAWWLTRREKNPQELGLWLTLVFTMAGIRDFAATVAEYDLTEYFLVPLDRILILVVLPLSLGLALSSRTMVVRLGGWFLSAALLISGSVFPTLSFAGWGWLVWVLEILGIALGLWWRKKTAPQGSGLSESAT